MKSPKIVISLARIFSDYPDHVAYYSGKILYPEGARHATDICIWLVEEIKKGEDMYILTQSDTIVNFLGHLIHYNAFDYKNAQIHIYDNKELIRTSTYSKEGIVENWRYGWFLPATEIQDELIRSLNPQVDFNV